jgi:Fic family protein
LAAEMHERLVTIHPFIDGNGRTSRLVMNLVYCNMATSLPISKDYESRMRYYQTLETAQTKTQRRFLLFIAQIEKKV